MQLPWSCASVSSVFLNSNNVPCAPCFSWFLKHTGSAAEKPPHSKLNRLTKQVRWLAKQRLIDVASKPDAKKNPLEMKTISIGNENQIQWKWKWNPLEMKVKSIGNETEIQWISLLKALFLSFHRALWYNGTQFCCSYLSVWWKENINVQHGYKRSASSQDSLFIATCAA